MELEMMPPLSAGVLCYSIPPNSDEIFFLLGRECHIIECKNLVRKCWCDFGGKMEQGEKEEDTASREFFEESMGIVCTNECIDSECHHSAQEECILEHHYNNTKLIS